MRAWLLAMWGFVIVGGLALANPNAAHAQTGGYVYTPQSYYMLPPIRPIAPLWAPATIVMRPAPPPYANISPPLPLGSTAPLIPRSYVPPAPGPYVPPAPGPYDGAVPAPSLDDGTMGDPYSYRVHVPYAPDYLYRFRRTGNAVYVRQGWGY